MSKPTATPRPTVKEWITSIKGKRTMRDELDRVQVGGAWLQGIADCLREQEAIKDELVEAVLDMGSFLSRIQGKLSDAKWRDPVDGLLERASKAIAKAKE